MNRKQFKLRWAKPFWPDWKSGSGKGQHKTFGIGTLVEVTDSHDKKRLRVRVIGTDYQSYCYMDNDVKELEPVDS